MKLSFVLLAASMTLSAAAQAQSSTTSTRATIPGVVPESASSTMAEGDSKLKLRDVIKNKKFEEENVVTDAKLKADAGSLSKYSLKFNLSYYGGTLSDLGAKDQPNPDNSISPKSTAIGGSFGGRYRLDPTSSITAGAGMKAIHPFHGMDRFDTNTPYLNWDKLLRVGGIQMRSSPGVSYITIPEYTRVGEYAGLNYDLSTIYNIGTSGFAVGVGTSIAYYFYNRDYNPAPVKLGGDGKASRYTWSFAPTVKYNFSDKFNVNLGSSIGLWNARGSTNQYELLNNSVTGSLGLGYAFTRDIYVGPYISFYPDKLSTDRSTFNLSTSFSLL